MAELVPSKWTKRSAWMDPDFLMTKYITMGQCLFCCNDTGMHRSSKACHLLCTIFCTHPIDFTASRTEFTFWSIWSAPLLVSTDLRHLHKDADKRAILMNDEVIAINQDGLATAGDRILKRADGGQVWSRDLANGDKCVVLYNNGLGKLFGGADVQLGVSWEQIGWKGGDLVSVRDLWKKETLGSMTTGLFNVTIKARDVMMLRLRRLKVE